MDAILGAGNGMCWHRLCILQLVRCLATVCLKWGFVQQLFPGSCVTRWVNRAACLRQVKCVLKLKGLVLPIIPGPVAIAAFTLCSIEWTILFLVESFTNSTGI